MLVSMLPVVELRGGIPFGVAQGLGHIPALIASIIGNLIPVPFLILFTRRILLWLRKRSRRLDRLVSRLETRANEKGKIVQKYQMIGLCILVAIPLPGTGAWTGALVAAFLDLRVKYAMPAITLGVLIAGVVVTVITYGFSFFLS